MEADWRSARRPAPQSVTKVVYSRDGKLIISGSAHEDMFLLL